jgi:hypothetical protein
MDTLEAYEVAKTVRSAGTGVDSSHLRGSTTSRAQEEGLVNVEKYNRVNAVLSSVEVFDGLLHGVEEHVNMLKTFPTVGPLLAAALKLGVSPDLAIAALFVNDALGARLDVAALAELLDEAADDIEAAGLARLRLTSPAATDMSLDDFAAELGVDLEQVRADVTAGAPHAQHT